MTPWPFPQGLLNTINSKIGWALEWIGWACMCLIRVYPLCCCCSVAIVFCNLHSYHISMHVYVHDHFCVCLATPSTDTTSIFNCAISSTTIHSTVSTSVATISTGTTIILTTISTFSTTTTFTTAISMQLTITIPSTTTTITTDVTDEASSSSDVNVGIIVVPIIIIIVITLVVVALTIAFYWWRRKKQLHNVYETMLQSSSTCNQKPVHTEVNKGQDSKEPEYMEICKNMPTEKVTMQDNPAYSISFEPPQNKMEMSKSVHSTKQGDKVTMQDNPAYSIPSECQVEIPHNPAYSPISFTTEQ